MSGIIRPLGRWAPVLVWAALIYLVSDQSRLPQAPTGLLDLLLKKGGHLTAYAVLAVLVYRALGKLPGDRGRARFIMAWVLTVLYAVTDEIHQSHVPGRTAAAFDVAIDGSGALLGLSLRLALRRWGAERLPAPWRRAPSAHGGG